MTRWWRSVTGDWLLEERTIAARLAESYVNDPGRDAAWLEQALDRAIARFGLRVFR